MIRPASRFLIPAFISAIPGGYASISGGGVTFHYYTQDYLGTGNSIPSFPSIDPLCEKYHHLSPYLYCANNPVNYIDLDGKDVYVWATTLPDGPSILKYATHTFITVTTSNGETKYYAYGSELDGMNGAIMGRLCRREYNQDKKIYSGNGNPDLLKSKIFIDVPEGMTQDEFDQKVISVAESFGNVDGIKYNMLPLEENEGNCNTSTTTILFKSGVSEEKIKEIDKKVPLIDVGFGTVKPWTKEEQENAVKNQKRRYEALEKALP